MNGFGVTSRLAAFFSVGFLAAAAGAQTIVVDTVEDVVDFLPPQTVSELPGPDGEISLREAVLAANHTPGSQTIGFAVPRSQWWQRDDVALMKIVNGSFVITDGAIVLDGTTQTVFTGDTNPDGPEIEFWNVNPNAALGTLFHVESDDNVFRGLGDVRNRGYYFRLVGHRNTVVGCSTKGALWSGIGIDGSDNVIGGANDGDSNVLSGFDEGVRLFAGASSNRIVGNRITGIDHAIWLQKGADGNVIGGSTPAERNVMSGSGHPSGSQLDAFGGELKIDSDGNVVVGNYIGIDVTGTRAMVNPGNWGIEVNGSYNEIGRPGAGNVIGGFTVQKSFRTAIAVRGDAHDNIVQGNRIGTDASGANPIPNEKGIWITTGNGTFAAPSNNLIGGTGPGESNVIAFNSKWGVWVYHNGRGNKISGNSIHANGLLGIDLDWQQEVTPNDSGDLDTGPNDLQNFPELTSVLRTGPGLVQVTGVLHSRVNRGYALELFANTDCTTRGHGQGEVFLGTTTVTTGAAGTAAWSASLPIGPAHRFLTATATDLSTGDTSEFSACLRIAPGTDATAVYGAGCAGSGGFVPALRAADCPRVGAPFVVDVTRGLGRANAAILIGAVAASAPIGGGCTLLLGQPLPGAINLTLDGWDPGTGTARASLAVPPSLLGARFTMQAFVVDRGAPLGFVTTNGLAVKIE